MEFIAHRLVFQANFGGLRGVWGLEYADTGIAKAIRFVMTTPSRVQMAIIRIMVLQ